VYATSYLSLIDDSNFARILHRFSDTATYWLKIAIFPTPLSFTPSLGKKPFELLDELFTAKTRVFGLSLGEDFVILACVVLTQCRRVTDERTDGQTDRRRTDNPIVANIGPCIASYADAL